MKKSVLILFLLKIICFLNLNSSFPFSHGLEFQQFSLHTTKDIWIFYKLGDVLQTWSNYIMLFGFRLYTWNKWYKYFYSYTGVFPSFFQQLMSYWKNPEPTLNDLKNYCQSDVKLICSNNVSSNWYFKFMASLPVTHCEKLLTFDNPLLFTGTLLTACQSSYFWSTIWRHFRVHSSLYRKYHF